MTNEQCNMEMIGTTGNIPTEREVGGEEGRNKHTCAYHSPISAITEGCDVTVTYRCNPERKKETIAGKSHPPPHALSSTFRQHQHNQSLADNNPQLRASFCAHCIWVGGGAVILIAGYHVGHQAGMVSRNEGMCKQFTPSPTLRASNVEIN
ncbi:hypothetical protein LOAG_02061 [Loa loa]|uniref:Uncharacterized protein n=1 Tax=Loa loa TaxID=7209 RepID=A0A1S0U9E5_LOALO|nr:hypothetical protein LOAG_02061 [Loa loa]EFO26431.1 hypothetical protein LOAG_02061 [Loa loa]